MLQWMRALGVSLMRKYRGRIKHIAESVHRIAPSTSLRYCFSFSGHKLPAAAGCSVNGLLGICQLLTAGWLELFHCTPGLAREHSEPPNREAFLSARCEALMVRSVLTKLASLCSCQHLCPTC